MRNKKIIMCGLAVAMMLSICACGKKENKSEPLPSAPIDDVTTENPYAIDSDDDDNKNTTTEDVVIIEETTTEYSDGVVNGRMDDEQLQELANDLGVDVGDIAQDIDNVSISTANGSNISLNLDNANNTAMLVRENNGDNLVCSDTHGNSAIYWVLDGIDEPTFNKLVNTQIKIYSESEYIKDAIYEYDKTTNFDGQPIRYAKMTYEVAGNIHTKYCLGVLQENGKCVICRVDLGYNNSQDYTEEQIFSLVSPNVINLQ